MPIDNFHENAKILDNKRLGKQRIEAAQILATLGVAIEKINGEPYKPTHKNHPCVHMWQNFEEALKQYYNSILDEWVLRGYKNNMKFLKVSNDVEFPLFFGSKKFHDSHKSNLLRKNYDYYSKFNWDVHIF